MSESSGASSSSGRGLAGSAGVGLIDIFKAVKSVLQFAILQVCVCVKRLYELLQDKEESEFTIVTIPTELAVAESKRLLISLDKTGILVRRILINQVLPHDFDVNNTDEKTRKYLENIRNGQSKAIVELENNSKEHSIPLLRVPYFDTEVRTVYGLRAISQSLFPQQQS